jgi:alpha-L-rhamnosidase
MYLLSLLCAWPVRAVAADAEFGVGNLRCEYRVDPVGVDIVKPRLIWILESSTRGQKQTAYQVLVAGSRDLLDSGKGDLWDSGKVESDQTIHVEYEGKTLKSGMRCWWKVRVWPALGGGEGDATGKASEWSKPATWTMGPVETGDPSSPEGSAVASWGGARWIADPRDRDITDAGALPATMLRRSFKVSGKVKRAVVYASGLGAYELRLNGKRVGDQLLAPEFTCYDNRIQYQGHDVTDMIMSGANGIGATLATGWNGEHFFGMSIGIGKNPFQGRRGFLMRLDIELENGKRQTVITDPSWRSTRDGPIRAGSIYDGEAYDARLEWQGWDTGEFDDTAWRQVIIADYIENPKDFKGESVDRKPALRWQRNEPIRIVKELKPVGMTEPESGVFIIDMGQNMVGWCRIQVHGRQGTEIKARYGEVLDEDGTLYTANLRRARQTDTYIKRSDAMEVFEPRFTYHGFRYVEITGRTNIPWRYEPERRVYKPDPKHVTGCVVHSASPDAGTFKCSSDHVNRLMDMIVWTQRGNMHSVPTDCPQRDERAGWMGDIQSFSQTAIFNMDMAGFFSKWLGDVRDSQRSDGSYANFSPMDLERWKGGTPAWADAGTIVPWRVYQNYADTRLLEEHYESARRWVDYVHNKNPNLLWDRDLGNSFNDWLNGDKIKKDGWPTKGGEVPARLLATAFFAHSAEIVAKMAFLTGRKEDARKYAELSRGIKAAFIKRYVKPDGSLEGNTQAGYALALRFNLLPAELRPKAAKHMVNEFKRYDGHMSTGIQTSHRLMLELTRNGYNDEAYRLLNMKEFPSWGFMMEQGATTIWERWDGYVKGRGFQDPTMNSFNHWALGAVGEWIWRNIVGLNPDESKPGWKHFVIAPRPGGDLTWARGRYESIRGTIISDWRVENGSLRMDVTVPPNTSATVQLPAEYSRDVTIDGQAVTESPFVRALGMKESAVAFAVAPGQYRFSGDKR